MSWRNNGWEHFRHNTFEFILADAAPYIHSLFPMLDALVIIILMRDYRWRALALKLGDLKLLKASFSEMERDSSYLVLITSESSALPSPHILRNPLMREVLVPLVIDDNSVHSYENLKPYSWYLAYENDNSDYSAQWVFNERHIYRRIQKRTCWKIDDLKLPRASHSEEALYSFHWSSWTPLC